MGSVSIKDWLGEYQGLKFEYDTWYERWARLDNEQYIPAMREGDGSKRNPGASDRMANAVTRRMEFEEQTAEEIGSIRAGMQAIEKAINSLSDPMHRGILKQRYIVGDGNYRPKKWRYVAMVVRHEESEAAIKFVQRLHNEAIQKLGEMADG